MGLELSFESIYFTGGSGNDGNAVFVPGMFSVDCQHLKNPAAPL